MPLDILEVDFLGDLSVDTYGVWEIFASVRLHFPGRTDAEVLKIGEEYLSRWIEKGWITVAAKPLYPTQVKSLSEVTAFVQKHGVTSTTFADGAPSLDITEAGIQALPKTNSFRFEARP
jgi:hypothetical protein